ncbi:hypothetical protein [Acinetobacter seifertii]|uniref:Uncharacterized protein n=1 Tax=Acinetobacter seifertii TaxID=1530123 RepID=A0A7H2PW59_9GAMM|nr:hypothetical protein [Acinetobacter seifertii]QNX07080.1 hypothetical protein IC796_09625 [Acinetobacter seifertii]QNX07092.1 hypothetical protein IC796_09695 [Acinetobacter seifertii]
MRYKRSIGAMRKEDWQQLIEILDEYLIFVQQDNGSTNDKINDVKLLVHKLQHHIDSPAQQSYSFNRWS